MPRLRSLAVRRAGALLLLLSLPLAAQVASDDPSVLPAEAMPRAAHSLLLDVTRTDAGWFAVGERGHVLSSTDGRDWKQVVVPTRSTLTCITAVGNDLWAGGHDGVILHSGDGGKSWQAQRRDPYHLVAGQDVADRDPRQGAPIMDILFTDAQNGIAIGAYSLMLATSDGGKTWTPRQAIAPSAAPATPAAPMQGDVFSAEDLMLDEESDPHFNAIARTGDNAMVIVGERGTVLRSTDGGLSWSKLGFPYKGSMFGVLSFEGGRLLAFGLRGNVYASGDDGASWSKVAAQGSASLMGGVALANGGAVLVGANGTMLHRASADAAFAVTGFRNAAGETPTLSSVVPAADGRYVVVGAKGADLATLQ